jgi:hypothetical protein
MNARTLDPGLKNSHDPHSRIYNGQICCCFDKHFGSKFPIEGTTHDGQKKCFPRKQTVKVQISLRARHEDAWGSGVTNPRNLVNSWRCMKVNGQFNAPVTIWER